MCVSCLLKKKSGTQFCELLMVNSFYAGHTSKCTQMETVWLWDQAPLFAARSIFIKDMASYLQSWIIPSTNKKKRSQYYPAYRCSPGDYLCCLLQTKLTLIRQLLRSCLIRIYFSCLCVVQGQRFIFVPKQKLCKSHEFYNILFLANKYSRSQISYEFSGLNESTEVVHSLTYLSDHHGIYLLRLYLTTGDSHTPDPSTVSSQHRV